MGGRPWTKAEETYLRKNIGKGIGAVMSGMDRTAVAIRERARILGYTADDIGHDKAYNEVGEYQNAIKRKQYYVRLNQAMCTRCGKRWAEAGGFKCRICRERANKWQRLDNIRAKKNAERNARRAEHREKGLCTECGKKLPLNELGVFTRCATCRAKSNELAQVRKIRDRLHGIKRRC